MATRCATKRVMRVFCFFVFVFVFLRARVRVCAALLWLVRKKKLLPLLREATAYILMRPFLDDVAAKSDFCGAVPGRSQELLPEFHGRLVDALVPIPAMEPGDMVFWHPDLVHAVQVLQQPLSVPSVNAVASHSAIVALPHARAHTYNCCRCGRRTTTAQKTAPFFTFR